MSAPYYYLHYVVHGILRTWCMICVVFHISWCVSLRYQDVSASLTAVAGKHRWSQAEEIISTLLWQNKKTKPLGHPHITAYISVWRMKYTWYVLFGIWWCVVVNVSCPCRWLLSLTAIAHCCRWQAQVIPFAFERVLHCIPVYVCARWLLLLIAVADWYRRSSQVIPGEASGSMLSFIRA